MCLSAAKQLATVVGMLRAESRLTRRCWIIIQSAYTAGLIISLDVSRHRGRPSLESAFTENMALISSSLGALQRCASFDVVADRYSKILAPVLRVLSIPTRRASSTPSNEVLLDHILMLVKTPFGGHSSVIDQDFFLAIGGGLPEHHRFLAPKSSLWGDEQHLQHPRHQQLLRGDVEMEDAAPLTQHQQGQRREKKYPFRSKEEYEAFFKRVT